MTAVNDAPTSEDKTVTTEEDVAYTFSSADFAFSDVDGDALDERNGWWHGAARWASWRCRAAAVQSGRRSVPASELGNLTFTPAQDGNGTGYANFTFRVSDGTDESTAAYTITIDVTAANDTPTGQPVITGTARVGEELEADTSGIADVDGLPGTFRYEWVRVDGDMETAIEDATSRTYRLVTADSGKRLKVKVSFTDDGGNDEEVSSDAYPAAA